MAARPHASLPTDPIDRFAHHFGEAARTEPFDAARAALATATPDGRPSVRFVLVKAYGPRGFTFYTHFGSRKAKELDANPHAALAFHWHTTGVQVRVEGRAVREDDAVADRYFASRPRGSQIGAWASPQSEPIPDRALLEARVAEVNMRFDGQPVPRPPDWGGCRVIPSVLEFWYDRPDRLHVRERFDRTADGWARALLAP